MLYDYKRDGDIKPGEALVTYEDGTRAKVNLIDLESAYFKPVPPREQPAGSDRVSFGEVICYVDGRAWGISDTGRTVCMGSEGVVKEAVSKNLKSGFPVIDQIINLERKLQEENNAGSGDIQVKPSRTQRAIRTRSVRVRPTAHIEYKPVNTRHLKARQRVPGSKAKFTKQGVFNFLGPGLVETKGT